MISIHAFVFNVFGALDNLAWIWVQEKGLTKEDGKPLPNEWVGIAPKNKQVRASFSKELNAHLNTIDQWFEI
jgi:hypothetical protein